MKDISVYFKEVEQNRWLAASGEAPYFCFEADSRERVREIVVRALRFYNDVGARRGDELRALKKRERNKAIPAFSKKDKVSARELVPA